MTHQHIDDKLGDKRICFECVGEEFLLAQISQHGEVKTCSYCGETVECITMDDMADRVEAAFMDHYQRTSDHPDSLQQAMLSDRESSCDWYRDGDPVVDAIECAAEIPTAAAMDIQSILDDRYGDFDSAAMGEETEFSLDAHYEQIGASNAEWLQEWREFELSLKTEARFFSRVGAAYLASVFGKIDKLNSKDGRPLVVDAGPQTVLHSLYRARVFQSDDKLNVALCRPDLHLGSTPANLASAGRMNARGISVFYGATEAAVAIAEVRPPVGSKVAVANFAISRPLRLLDLTALEYAQDSGSIFDPTLKRRLERVAFLQSLGQRITKPVMPDDEAFDYLATQAIADFLATENDPRLDGIVFQSAQSGVGRNVVLFHHAAMVDELQFPLGTQIEARQGYETEDGWEPDYSVIEQEPQLPATTRSADDEFWIGSPIHLGLVYRDGEGVDHREVTLRVDASTVEVHQVELVNYQCKTHQVCRVRRATKDCNF